MSKRAFSGHSPYSISQNFITSAKVIQRLLDQTTLCKTDHVWEIGAGKGHITRQLLARCARLTAVEIDPALCRYLSSQFKGAENLTLLAKDFLHASLPYRQPYKVFANIPFSATTDIIKKLVWLPTSPEECWLIMEKGAAKRFCGTPKESIHSLLLKPFFDVRICYHLQRENFHPAPSVDTVMLHMRRKAVPDIHWQHYPQFERFLRLSLGKRPPLSAQAAKAALRRAGLSLPLSATLSYVQWLCLFRYWARLPAASCTHNKKSRQ